MKKYIIPTTQEVVTLADDLMKFTSTSDITQAAPGRVSAVQRMASLGNTTVRSSLGTLGSTGSIRSIGTLK